MAAKRKPGKKGRRAQVELNKKSGRKVTASSEKKSVATGRKSISSAGTSTGRKRDQRKAKQKVVPQQRKQTGYYDRAGRVIPQPIDDASIEKLGKSDKFPNQGPIGKHKPNIDGKGMVVAILDTGIFEHQDLKDKILKKVSYKGSVQNSVDKQGHGTHIAGIIAGSQSKTNSQVKGIAPGARIVSVKITTGENENTTLWRIADGIEKINAHNQSAKQNEKVTVIVICFNAFDNVEKFIVTQHHRLARLIYECYQNNIPVVCSAGNNRDKFQQQNGIAYPAYIKHIIAVACTNNIPNASGYGTFMDIAQRINPDNKVFGNFFITAPGYRTISTGITSKTAYSEMSGSSQAAAVIAGTILLLQQQYYEQYRRLPTVDKVYELLKSFR
jgi:subtilisin family serine protease